VAALHKEDREQEIKDANKRVRRQEMERLLYVALTRARHTLVLALDRGLFSPKTDAAQDFAQLRFLRGNKGESSVHILDALEDAPETCPETQTSWEQSRAASDAIFLGVPPLSESTIARARHRAGEFMRKQNPSGYEDPVDPPNDTAATSTPRPLSRSAADNPATLYGSWWHTLFEHFPWKANPSRWQEAFEALQSSSPDPGRSAREWDQLHTTLGDSPAARFLSRPGTIVHTEFPFLWRIDEQSCLEGVIDLLAIDPAEKRCLLLDWKTNRSTSGQEDELCGRYISQVAAYWTAVGEMTQFEVEAGLFSTSLGRWLIYTREELRSEWARLRSMRPDERSTAIAAGDA
jgi:ATP-dependent exoDNAse (exonuclease V) beta subunit